MNTKTDRRLSAKRDENPEWARIPHGNRTSGKYHKVTDVLDRDDRGKARKVSVECGFDGVANRTEDDPDDIRKCPSCHREVNQ